MPRREGVSSLVLIDVLIYKEHNGKRNNYANRFGLLSQNRKSNVSTAEIGVVFRQFSGKFLTIYHLQTKKLT